MHSFHKNIAGFSLFLFLSGCSSAPPWDNDFKLAQQEEPFSFYLQREKPLNVEEVYVWVPPNEGEIVSRRSRQRELDRDSRKVDKLLNSYNSVKEALDSLEASADRLETRINDMESAVSDL